MSCCSLVALDEATKDLRLPVILGRLPSTCWEVTLGTQGRLIFCYHLLSNFWFRHVLEAALTLGWMTTEGQKTGVHSHSWVSVSTCWCHESLVLCPQTFSVWLPLLLSGYGLHVQRSRQIPVVGMQGKRRAHLTTHHFSFWIGISNTRLFLDFSIWQLFR